MAADAALDAMSQTFTEKFPRFFELCFLAPRGFELVPSLVLVAGAVPGAEAGGGSGATRERKEPSLAEAEAGSLALTCGDDALAPEMSGGRSARAG